MAPLLKASLVAIDGKPKGKPLNGETAVDVQFNPASMHLVLAAAADRGKTPARQDQQHLGSGSLTLSLDLHFDTADESTDEKPVNVRDRTAKVARFMLPGKGSKQPPPRVRFQWGTLVLDGVMGSYSEDLDLFSSQGVPLRAKVSISISGQNPALAAAAAAPGGSGGPSPSGGAGASGGAGGTGGAAGAGGAGGAGAVNGAPGTVGGGVSPPAGANAPASAAAAPGDSTGTALAGESAAEFAARMGLDPAAWRAVAGGLDSTLSIPAGVEIGFTSGLSSAPGLGTAAGLETGAAALPAAVLGLAGEAAAPARAGAAPGLAAGFALAAAGGVQAAVETARIADTAQAATTAIRAFASRAAAPAPAAPPPAATQPRRPLRAAGVPLPVERRPAAPAPLPPRADARATSYGYGVPLRPRAGGATEARAGMVGTGAVLVAARAPGAQSPEPARTVVRHVARAGCGCGCGGGHR